MPSYRENTKSDDLNYKEECCRLREELNKEKEKNKRLSEAIVNIALKM